MIMLVLHMTNEDIENLGIKLAVRNIKVSWNSRMLSQDPIQILFLFFFSEYGKAELASYGSALKWKWGAGS